MIDDKRPGTLLLVINDNVQRSDVPNARRFASELLDCSARVGPESGLIIAFRSKGAVRKATIGQTEVMPFVGRIYQVIREMGEHGEASGSKG